ncbi:MAG: FkbM family methyltransferase [Thermofilaceae archaeon]|nr:FkbM family methyltransferase [Thermofilaceae archaeon]MDW8004264.1 FkbM family methyltransferase [Thermofilaceae archaeon]
MLSEASKYVASLELDRLLAASFNLASACCLKYLKPNSIVKLNLPMNLCVYAQASLTVDVVRNVLHVYYYRDYEMLPGFKPEPGWRVVDIGAFIGLYSLRAAKLVGVEGFVLAVEPLPSTYRALKLNVTANKLSNVETLCACVSSSTGLSELLVPVSPLNASLRPDYVEAYGGVHRRVKVRTFSLDTILKKFEPVHLLKLDVEGVELNVIDESKLLNPRLVKRVVVEVHPPFVKPMDVAEALERKGYGSIVHLPEDAFNQAFVYAF